MYFHEAPHLPGKTEGGLENGLANPWKRKNITNKPHAGYGPETKQEMSDCFNKTAGCGISLFEEHSPDAIILPGQAGVSLHDNETTLLRL